MSFLLYKSDNLKESSFTTLRRTNCPFPSVYLFFGKFHKKNEKEKWVIFCPSLRSSPETMARLFFKIPQKIVHCYGNIVRYCVGIVWSAPRFRIAFQAVKSGVRRPAPIEASCCERNAHTKSSNVVITYVFLQVLILTYLKMLDTF